MVALPSGVIQWVDVRAAEARKATVVMKEYWKFGRWILLRNGLAYLAGNIYVPLVAMMLGLGAAGEFEIGRQLVAPFYVIPMGFSLYLLPELANLRKLSGYFEFRRRARRLLLIWLFVAAVAAVFLALFGATWLRLLIGDGWNTRVYLRQWTRSRFWDSGCRSMLPQRC